MLVRRRVPPHERDRGDPELIAEALARLPDRQTPDGPIGPRRAVGAMLQPTLAELSRPGRGGGKIPHPPADALDGIPPPSGAASRWRCPELNEPEVVRHFVNLSHLNYSVDGGFYPLGSCTMKYNPKINEWAARLPGFANAHPLAPDELVQGTLQLLYELQEMLAEISGMDAVTLQPAAGAHGELTGHPAHPRLSPRPRRSRSPGGDRPRLLAWHEPGHGVDGRLPDGDRALGAGRRRGPRRAQGRAGAHGPRP